MLVLHLMQYMKQQNEVENLLSLIFQSRGQVAVKDGQLWVAPVEIARKFGDQIRKLKPEILLAFGHCPVCARELVSKIEDRERIDGAGKQTKHHLYCSGPDLQHFDKWQF
jgi:hypothetical protein